MNVDEAVSSFANFVETICTCVQSKNGELLAELFDPMAYSLEEGVVGELVNRV